MFLPASFELRWLQLLGCLEMSSVRLLRAHLQVLLDGGDERGMHVAQLDEALLVIPGLLVEQRASRAQRSTTQEHSGRTGEQCTQPSEEEKTPDTA